MSMLEDHTHKRPVHNFDGIIENRANRPPIYFSLLFYGLILWGTVFCAYYLLSGWSSSAEYAEKKAAHAALVAAAAPAPATAAATAAADPAAQIAAGQQLYASHCAGCHGAEGQGGIGPDLTGANYKYGRSHDEVLTSIRDGRPGGMPGFGNQLTGSQTEELVAFTLSLQ